MNSIESVLEACQETIRKATDVKPGQKVIWWGAGKRFEPLLSRYVVNGGPLPKPDYFVDSTRDASGEEVLGVEGKPFSALLDEDPNATTVVISAGVLDLQGEIIKNELYYFRFFHIRSLEAALHILDNVVKLEESVSLISSEESRQIYLGVLTDWVRGRFFDPSLYQPSPYFNNEFICDPYQGILVLAGAFNGKHIERFLRWNPGGEVRAFEPSPKWSKYLAEKYKNQPNVRISNSILGGESAEVNYDPDDENNGLSARVEEKASNRTIRLAVEPLDYLLEEDVSQGSIRQVALDVEGTEISVLEGAKSLVQNLRPLLTVCLYHNAGDFLDVIPKIESISPGSYDFFVRHHSSVSVIETVLYALPKP